MAQPKIHVLFVCFGNACRSPMAEAIARSEASDVIEPASAGLYPLGQIPLHTQDALRRNGYSAEGLASKHIAPEAWRRADLVINMSGRIRELEFEEFEKVEDWNVPDPYGEDSATYQGILEEIRNRVRELANRLRDERRAAV
jgi:arsenate reductase (thioredoxin)